MPVSEPNLEDRPTPPSLKLDPGLLRKQSWLDRLAARRGLLAGLIALGALVLLASAVVVWLAASGRLSPAAATTPPSPQLELPPSLDDLVAEHPELAALLNDPSLGSVYKDFIVALESGGFEAAEELARLRGLLNDRDEIRITLVLDDAAYVPAIVGELQGAGITVEGSYRERINVGVPMDLIKSLAEQQGTQALFQQLSQMDHIVRLELPITKRIDRISSVEGEGVAIVGADDWHAAGFEGQSIRVGVLDLGFRGYRELLGSELPADVVAKSFVYGEEPEDSDLVHGTACAEIVHETAPQAELFLAYYDGTMVAQGQAVEWLLGQGVHIISHSAGAIVGPMDGTGEDAQFVDDVAAKSVLWVNSAGNEAESHYRGQFTDADGDGVHEFPDGDEKIGIWPYSDEMTVILNWDDWERVTEDYDLYLYDSQGELIASSRDTQDGGPGQIAAEGIELNQTSDSLYYAVIKAYDATRAVVFDLYADPVEVEFPVAEHSLGTPGDARGALTVGAVEHRDDSLASYSSNGPTNDGRLKPELSAPAGVSGASYGPNGFDGTSASTPYVAGAAALVWSAYPEYDPRQVIAYLQSYALDLGPQGPDPAFGYGRLRLPSPAGETMGTPVATLPATVPALDTLIPPLVESPGPAPGDTETPEPVRDGTPEPTDVLAPGSAGRALPTTLLTLIGITGLCGAAVAVGGVALLLVAWRRSREPVPGVSPSAPAARYTPPTPERAPLGVGQYGSLGGAGIAPMGLMAGVSVIGRGSDADIRLHSLQVSRHHVRIECAGGTCTVEDLQSSNGTFVNDKQVDRAILAPGDRLRIGDVELTYTPTDSPASLAGPSRAWIEVGGVRYPIPPEGMSIGRSHESTLQLADELVSRRHARIGAHGYGFEIADLGSANGTTVNGKSVRQQTLRDGDEIGVGRSQLQFHTRRAS